MSNYEYSGNSLCGRYDEFPYWPDPTCPECGRETECEGELCVQCKCADDPDYWMNHTEESDND